MKCVNQHKINHIHPLIRPLLILLNNSFSSGTFPELCAGGQYITIMPLFFKVLSSSSGRDATGPPSMKRVTS